MWTALNCNNCLLHHVALIYTSALLIKKATLPGVPFSSQLEKYCISIVWLGNFTLYSVTVVLVYKIMRKEKITPISVFSTHLYVELYRYVHT